MIARVRGSVEASLFRISRAWASTATLAGMARRISFHGPTTSDVVSGLLIVAVAIPYVIWRVWRANTDERADDRMSFREWTSSQFETWQDHQKGSSAATEIILPIAAAAVGMTAFAIVSHYAALHASA